MAGPFARRLRLALLAGACGLLAAGPAAAFGEWELMLPYLLEPDRTVAATVTICTELYPDLTEEARVAHSKWSVRTEALVRKAKRYHQEELAKEVASFRKTDPERAQAFDTMLKSLPDRLYARFRADAKADGRPHCSHYLADLASESSRMEEDLANSLRPPGSNTR